MLFLSVSGLGDGGAASLELLCHGINHGPSGSEPCVFPALGDPSELSKERGTAAKNKGRERRILLMPAALMRNQISFLDFYFLL